MAGRGDIHGHPRLVLGVVREDRLGGVSFELDCFYYVPIVGSVLSSSDSSEVSVFWMVTCHKCGGIVQVQRHFKSMNEKVVPGGLGPRAR